MNQEVIAVELAVGDFIVSKWYVADSQIEEVLSVCFLKPGDSDIRLRIQLLSNPAGNAVQLHTIQGTAFHAFWQKPEEIADTARRFQDAAGMKAHLLHSGINSTDDGR